MRNLNAILQLINKTKDKNLSYLENRKLHRNLFQRVYQDKKFISIMNKINSIVIMDNNKNPSGIFRISDDFTSDDILYLKSYIVLYKFPVLFSINYHDLIHRQFSKEALNLLKTKYRSIEFSKNINNSLHKDLNIDEEMEKDFYFLQRNIIQELRYRKRIHVFFKYFIRELDKAYSGKD